MDCLTVPVPIKRYLKKYLYGLECIPYNSPIDTRKGGHVCVVMRLLFTGKMSLNYSKKKMKGLNDMLPVVLPWTNAHRSQIVITDQRVRFLNTFLYKSFIDTMLIQVEAAQAHNSSVTQAQILKDEMLRLEIVDDLDYDTLKKAVDRLKKSRENQDFFAPICPVR